MSITDKWFGANHELLIKRDIILIIIALLILAMTTFAQNETNLTNSTDFNQTGDLSGANNTNATDTPPLDAKKGFIELAAGGLGFIQNILNINLSQAFGMTESNVWKVVAGISMCFTAWKLGGLAHWIGDNLQTILLVVGVALILSGIGFLAW